MESSGGYSLIHTKGLTKEEAEKEMEHHSEFFPECDWWIEPHNKDDDKEDKPRHYNKDACDGWEDIYNRY